MTDYTSLIVFIIGVIIIFTIKTIIEIKIEKKKQITGDK